MLQGEVIKNFIKEHMIRNRIILNSDAVNRYGFRLPISILESGLDQTYLEGMPTLVGHDFHRPIGWTKPFGLYLEPGLCRTVGEQFFAETSEESENIQQAHSIALEKRHQKHCKPYIEQFSQILSTYISDNATYLSAGCVCCLDKDITVKLYPSLFAKADKDGLIYFVDLLEHFSYIGNGIFKDLKSELAVIAHPYFRKSLSAYNSINHFLIDELIKQSSNSKINIRLALDRNMIGLAKTYHDTVELEFWRGPKFNDDISKIKPGVTVYGSNDMQRSHYGISQTEFWWKNDDSEQILEVEELRDRQSMGIEGDKYGCRYVHSIFDRAKNSFEHFDGAIRMYDTDKMLMRIERDIKSAGKNSEYTKLFRVDGQLAISDWKTLTCHFYQSNPLIHEYFGEPAQEVYSHSDTKNKSILEERVPYSMAAGDGIRLLVSYHSLKKSDHIPYDRYISAYDSLTMGDETFNVIENDVIEIKKALNRLGTDLSFPVKVPFTFADDSYWNIPAISHGLSSDLEKNISQTLVALQMVVEGINNKEKSKILSFTISWEDDTQKQVTISVIGHCLDVLKWLKANEQIPIRKDSFKSWLEGQKYFINKYPLKEDRPSVFEIVSSDGVLFIKRRSITTEVKYEFRNDENNKMMIGIKFNKDQEELEMAYRNGELNIAPEYILEATKCNKCGEDYRMCPHSKYLDDNVSETVIKAELVNIIWTNRNLN